MSDEHHRKAQATAERNLQAAREKAAHERDYDSASTRSALTTVMLERFGKPPRDWQLDVAEALILGLDCIVLAGTGSGKTMPFIMPLLLDNESQTLVISPLKVLQDDHASWFTSLGVRGGAVNQDTWGSRMEQSLKSGEIRGILTSPEMCLEHDGFRKVLLSAIDKLSAIVIDEAHCISQWGGDFRKSYGEIGKLRSFVSPSIPVLATTATMPPGALQDIQQNLGINPQRCFFLNLGNDRANVSPSVRVIKSAHDFDSVKKHLSRSTSVPETADDLVKTIVFVNERSTAQLLAREIQTWLPADLRHHVDYIHALRGVQRRRSVMSKFRSSESKILFATETAGMGTDIPDIELVVQFGVPSSLSVWTQRAGRAGRDPSINARAILLAEEAMFEQISKKGFKPDASHATSTTDPPEVPLPTELDDEDNDDDVECTRHEGERLITPVPLAEGKQWRKSVEENMRQWIETQGCRRAITNQYFSNPSWTIQAPTHTCCDNCQRRTQSTLAASATV